MQETNNNIFDDFLPIKKLISNNNSPKDMAFLKLCSTAGAIRLLNDAPAPRDGKGLEELQEIFDKYHKRYQNAPGIYNTWVKGFKFDLWNDIPNLNKKINAILSKTLSKVMIKKHFAYTCMAASEYHRKIDTLDTEFQFGKKCFESRAKRIHLKAFSKTGNDEFRTSMEAKLTPIADPKNKRNLLVNGWIQSISKKESPTLSYGRSGAYTDFQDVLTNIQDMHQVLETLNEDLDEITNFGVTKAEQMQKIHDREKVLLDMAAASISTQALSLGRKIAQRKAPFNLATKLMPFTQISLLHPTTDKKEFNMLKDMQWVLKQFDGKKVFFDGQSGLDNQGNLHIPEKILDLETLMPLCLTCETLLYNISVKGSGRDLETKVNRKALAKTKQLLERYSDWAQQNTAFSEENSSQIEKFKILEKDLLSSKGSYANYTIPADLCLISHLMGPISINCKSGKDRSGGLCEELSLRYIKKYDGQEKHDDFAMRKKIHDESLSLNITGINTFVKAYKLSPWELTHTGKSWWEKLDITSLFIST